MLQRIGLERVIDKCDGRTLHKQGDMALYSFPLNTEDRRLHILKVKCPTTQNTFFLQVPPDMRKCEQARQWTFDNDDGTHIEFVKET